MIGLSEHMTYRKLLRFTFPSVVMMLFTSFYVVIDGWFVSNLVGKTPFSALNFIYPYIDILAGVGFLFGTGGSALIGKTLGERKPEKANAVFSELVYISMAVGLALSAAGMLLVKKAAWTMGARGRLLDDCVIYGGISMIGLPGLILQYEFQCLCATAGKPQLGLWSTVAAGAANIILDALFMAGFSWGLAGAAAASAASQLLGGLIPVLYFARKNSSHLQLKRTKFDGKSMISVCTNGFSELLNTVSKAVVSMLYNAQLLKYIGEDGVAAYGVLMYVNLIFIGVFIGYTVGAAPLISYQYGAQNSRELHSLRCKSLKIIGAASLVMFTAGELLARPLSMLYTSYDGELLDITVRAFFIYSFSFLFSGFAIMGPSFFTALNNGLVSAVLSFLRTIVFQVLAVLILPLFLEVDGIWISMVAAELLAASAAFLMLKVFKNRYGY